jgi:hypothetical protein
VNGDAEAPVGILPWFDDPHVMGLGLVLGAVDLIIMVHDFGEHGCVFGVEVVGDRHELEGIPVLAELGGRYRVMKV